MACFHINESKSGFTRQLGCFYVAIYQRIEIVIGPNDGLIVWGDTKLFI